MDIKTFLSVIEIGETVVIEFKRCGNGIETDTYESVCAFLNRFGGDLFLGVLDDGTVAGVPGKAAPDMVKNFIKVISNPEMFSPTVYLDPKIMTDEEGHTIIHVHVPPSAEVHSFKKVIYDRVDDADVRVTSTSAIAQMYIRKQDIFTERKIYKYVDMTDLRLDMLPRLRQMAVNHAGGSHVWKDMSDDELLRSAGLIGTDRATGEKGFNLAAVMLLGKDDVIRDVCPAYLTDALLRKVNVDRYDDREIIQTNLIESFDQLMDFARKHLPDKFFLEDEARVSLRNILAREMISNTLMHREFTSSYMAKFVIGNDRMYTENANRAVNDGFITPENLEPNPKNPIIAAFFRNIGLADNLGSGTTRLFKYSKYYSGKDPEFREGDVFRIIVPLDDAYSFDYGLGNPESGIKNGNSEAGNGFSEPKNEPNVPNNVPNVPENVPNVPNNVIKEGSIEMRILNLLEEGIAQTTQKMSEVLCVSRKTIQRGTTKLRDLGMIERVGSNRDGYWVICDYTETE
ncbi:MAG: putative DNA binding domain-containing protein [Clostridiales bacterium]|nr:putative DNA binding domain-containing protein [Clostridiales bacterium]